MRKKETMYRGFRSGEKNLAPPRNFHFFVIEGTANDGVEDGDGDVEMGFLDRFPVRTTAPEVEVMVMET